MTATTLCFSFLYAALFIRYPKKYNDIILEQSQAYQLESSLLRAVIFTESKYKHDALSPKGAVGLMQLMPSTAMWCCEMLGLTFSEDMLFDPAMNITLGSYYLGYLFRLFDKENALAAYNAGQGNVKKWIQSGLEEYPYKETRDYVKRVLRAERIYNFI